MKCLCGHEKVEHILDVISIHGGEVRTECQHEDCDCKKFLPVPEEDK